MNQTYLIPVTILIGAMLIAGAVLTKDFSGTSNTAQPSQPVAQPSNNPNLSADDVRRSEYRHLYGNPDAPITIVEFSDFECPFCANLHPTLKRLVDESDGKIVWEYRHLPLPNHPNAFPGAIASECVSRELGTDAFWEFTNIVFKNIRSLNNEFFTSEALKLGVNQETFSACIASDEVKNLVTDDMIAADTLGGRGTPFSLIIDSNDNVTPVSGALPYEQWVSRLKTIN